MNVDAAVSKTENCSALGVVCRDFNEKFMGASALSVTGLSDPATLEAMACREAMMLAAVFQLQRFVVASDCLQVINNIKGTYDGTYSLIIKEIRARQGL
jgi:ribonuclease HI